MPETKDKGVSFEERLSGFSPAAPGGKNYLLAIGIDNYRHFNSLNNAVKDARDLITLLTRRYQFEPEQVVTLFNEEATRDRIIAELERLVRDVTDKDSVLIYFSGHGMIHPKTKRGYWIPVEAPKGDVSSYLTNATVQDYIEDIESLHTFLIVDSCFSGAIIPRADNFVAGMESLPSRWILTSGRQEVVSDGRPGRNSPFANSLLRYLEANKREDLPVSELVQHVKAITPRTAHQQPMGSFMFGVGDQGGEFIFHLKKDKAATGPEKPVEEPAVFRQQPFPASPEVKPAPQGRAEGTAITGRRNYWWYIALGVVVLGIGLYFIFGGNGNGGGTAGGYEQFWEKGMAAMEHGDCEAALEYFSRAREFRSPPELEANINRCEDELFSRNMEEGMAAFEGWSLEEARSALEQAARIRPGGEVEEWLQKLERREEYLSLFEQGKQKMEAGDFGGALDLFMAAREREVTPELEEHINHCRSQLEAGERERRYEELMAEGRRLYQQERWEEALRAFTTAKNTMNTADARSWMQRAEAEMAAAEAPEPEPEPGPGNVTYSVAVNDYPAHRDPARSRNLPNACVNMYTVRLNAARTAFEVVEVETKRTGSGSRPAATFTIAPGQMVCFEGFRSREGAREGAERKRESFFRAPPPYKNFGRAGTTLCQVNFLEIDQPLRNDWDYACSTSLSTPYQD